ncbi:universal stress protein [Halalkalicoccus subterraneus]|uniref:universal stress protein n=1 Tax=Halalkalicoccus subterraneus TaxID=2675002 RepID=UPI000EFC0418|nr:universal stress protein [Halalkalicoccus subterraneus]
MTNSILVPINGIPPTIAALNHVLTLEDSHEITVLQVCPIVERDNSIRQTVIPEAIDEQQEASRQTAEQIFSKATDYATEHDVTLKTATESGHPAERISAYAATNDITRIVIGTQEQSLLSRILRGSLPDEIMKRSSVPVTTIQTPTDESSRRSDGTDQERPLTFSRGIN